MANNQPVMTIDLIGQINTLCEALFWYELGNLLRVVTAFDADNNTYRAMVITLRRNEETMHILRRGPMEFDRVTAIQSLLRSLELTLHERIRQCDERERVLSFSSTGHPPQPAAQNVMTPHDNVFPNPGPPPEHQQPFPPQQFPQHGMQFQQQEPQFPHNPPFPQFQAQFSPQNLQFHSSPSGDPDSPAPRSGEGSAIAITITGNRPKRAGNMFANRWNQTQQSVGHLERQPGARLAHSRLESGGIDTSDEDETKQTSEKKAQKES